MLNLNTGETIYAPGTLANAVSSEPISLGQGKMEPIQINHMMYWDWILVRNILPLNQLISFRIKVPNNQSLTLQTNLAQSIPQPGTHR